MRRFLLLLVETTSALELTAVTEGMIAGSSRLGTQDSSREYKLGVEFRSASPAYWDESYDLRGQAGPVTPPSRFQIWQSRHVYLHGT
jgi:hypothetical protein